MNATEPRYAGLAARLLAPEATGDPAPDQRRDAIVAAMALAIAAKTRRRRALMAGGVAAVAAAASVALLVTAHRHTVTGAPPSLLTVETTTGNGIELVRGQAAQPLAPHGIVLAGDILQSAEDSTATLTTAVGTRLTLSSSARLHIDQLAPGWRFSLTRGQLQAQVAKLGAGERFVVSMPGGEVEVRGTTFRVAVAKPAAGCGPAETRSTVEVDEGTVAVRAGVDELLLHRGDTWTSPCFAATTGITLPAAPATPGAEPAVVPSTPPVVPAPSPRAPGRAAAPRSPVGPALTVEAPQAPALTPTAISRLAEQNDLFSAAMAAEQQGQHDEALRRLDTLLERFPAGPLSESARAEKQRILSAQATRP